MDSSDCAVNFRSSQDYDCRVFDSAIWTYHCTGTIDTARSSSIRCALESNTNRGTTFSVVD